jgi:hypothetical protein
MIVFDKEAWHLFLVWKAGFSNTVLFQWLGPCGDDVFPSFLLLSRTDLQSNWEDHFKCLNFDGRVPVPCYWVNFFFPAECSPPTNLLKTSEWPKTNPKDGCLEQCVSGPCKMWIPNPGVVIPAPTRSNLTLLDSSRRRTTDRRQLSWQRRPVHDILYVLKASVPGPHCECRSVCVPLPQVDLWMGSRRVGNTDG